MKKRGWAAITVMALLVSGCSKDFWTSQNRLEENPLAKFGQKKRMEDAKERAEPDSAYEAGEDSLFSFGSGSGLLGGGTTQGADSVRADKLFAGAMEVVMPLPIQVANREGGIISTDWKMDSDSTNRRYRVNIHITGQEPYGTVQVVVLKQALVRGVWHDRPADETAAHSIEQHIRMKAQVARP